MAVNVAMAGVGAKLPAGDIEADGEAEEESEDIALREFHGVNIDRPRESGSQAG